MTERAGHGDIVLVVEDSPENLSMLTAALEQAGMTVLVAVDGASALDLVTRLTPDVILMDAVMPGIDGFETTRRMKREAGLHHVPVIFMTGLSDTQHIVEGLEAGGVDYVTKPIVPNELVARIRVHLANARSMHSARVALDATGRFLIALTAAGATLWSTPQARRLLGLAFATAEIDAFTPPPQMLTWLRSNHAGQPYDGSSDFILTTPAKRLRVTFVERIGQDEFLLRLSDDDERTPDLLLKDKFSLTSREAEVLLWIARGKSNKDIADILGLSPRTVNKHLEQVYSKLGVENRASAAAIAVRTFLDHER